MTPNELLTSWLGDTSIALEQILKAPGLQVPTAWGRQQAFINFSKPSLDIVFAVQLQYNDQTAYLGLSKSSECNDLSLLAANLRTSPKEVLLAVFEAQSQYTLAALSQPIGISPKIVDIAPVDGDIWSSALPFTLATVEKQALIANGLFVLPQPLMEKFALLDYVSPLDASIVPDAPQKGTAIVAHFPLEQPDATLDGGDYLMLPEITMDQYPWPVVLLLDNNIALTAELIDSQTLQLKGVLDESPVQPDELAVSLGEVSVRYTDLVALMTEQTPNLPLADSQQVMKNGQIAARGHITSFYDNTAFEIEA